MEKIRFATVINCIDGRIQKPVAEWMKKYFNVHYVDSITEPGVDKVLLESGEVVELIKQNVLISVTAHNSCGIAVVGHYDCARNPVSEEGHRKQIKKCVEIIKSWGLGVPIVGLWVNKEWEVEIISDPENSGFA